ncbi:serpin family protein [Paenibacillus rhizovicinus]|uniref:Serpin family protein n=1 Tax=Paenibacillus rhizovicinus TaxID=2704463 RepID=A0A6C0P5E1_9BACL|nr:serpin family protein [Paenibacillus rhizovicinus]QHW33729.1 serpin family protein [Paenibacillus rhizovicinus]
MRVKSKRRMAMTAAAVLLVAALLGGCGESDQTVSKPVAPKHTAADVNKELVKSGNAFAMRLAEPLLSEAMDRSRNTVFSPLSVSFALSLLLNGAQGETREELMTLLAAKGADAETFNQSNEALMDLLQHVDPAVEFRIANAIFAQKGLALQSEFVKRMKERYAAPVSAIDFARSAAAAKTINDWTAKQTNDRIKELLTADSLSSDTVMMLLNAVYFNGTWQMPFDEANTKDAAFHLDGGQNVQVPMMAINGEFLHKAAPAYQAVQLHYGAGDWSMFVVLPADGSTLKDAEAAVLHDAAAWTAGYESGTGQVQLPRFKFEAAYNLNETLKSLGMVRSMDATLADFSGISPNGGLFVDQVLHKAFIEVNEKGTEAAAATAIGTDSGADLNAKPFVFRADRPFLFAIRNNATGTIAFLGSVADPTAAGS